MAPESYNAIAFKNVVKRKKVFPLHTYYNYENKKFRQYQVLTRMWNNENSYISGGNAKCHSHFGSFLSN